MHSIIINAISNDNAGVLILKVIHMNHWSKTAMTMTSHHQQLATQQDTVDAMPCAWIALDVHWDIVSVNQTFCEYVGIERSHVINTPLQWWVADESWSACCAYLYQPTEDRASFELKLKHIHGHRIILLASTQRENYGWQLLMMPQIQSDRPIFPPLSSAHIIPEDHSVYKEIINATGEGFWRLDAYNRIQEVNRALCQMLAYDELELLTKHPLDLVTAECRPIFQQQLDRIPYTHNRHYELEMRSRTGERIPVLLNASTLFDKDGNVSAVFTFISDLRELKHVEARLRQREAHLQEAQRLARLGQWQWDIKTGDLEWSEEVFHIFSQSPNHFSPSYEQFLSLVYVLDRNVVEQELKQAIAYKKPFAQEFRVERPDGSIRYVYGRGKFVLDEQGMPECCIGTVQDITDQKLAEQNLVDNTLFYQQFFTHNPAICLLTDVQTGQIVDANQAALRYYGYSFTQFKKHSLYSLTPQPFAFPNHTSANITCQHRLASGETQTVSLFISPLTLNKRELLYVIVQKH